MAQQTINVGASPNDGTGTPLRTAFQYTNSNFTELYTAVGPSGNNIVVPGSATITGAASAAGLSVTGSTIPTNGIYLPSANSLGFAYNSTLGMTLNSTGLGLGGTPSGVNRFAVWNGATQSLTLDTSGRLLVGTTSAFTDLTGSKEVRIGDSGMQTLTVASLPAGTATNIARGGVGGLVYVGGYNGTGQYGAVVLWTSSSATVVSVINGTGSTITFGVSAGFLQITSSLVLTQVTASCIRI